jgi:hypothetical protein
MVVIWDEIFSHGYFLDTVRGDQNDDLTFPSYTAMKREMSGRKDVPDGGWHPLRSHDDLN